MNQVRVHGDPFGEQAHSSLMRSFLRLCLGSGMRCSLSLSPVRERPLAAGERAVPLTDGVRTLVVGTRLPPAEIDLLARAAGEAIAATAPVVVFAPPHELADAQREAGLEWPQASIVVIAREGASAGDLLERVRAELRWAGCENPPHALEPAELASWLALPTCSGDGPVVFVGAADDAHGFDLWLAAMRTVAANGPRRGRVVLLGADAAALAGANDRLGDLAPRVQCVAGSFEPGHARDAAAIVLPWRGLPAPAVLVQALASGRPVCVSRSGAAAAVLGGAGTCLPIGGRELPAAGGRVAYFEPSGRALAVALQVALGDAAAAAAIGARARRHVQAALVRGRPAAPPVPHVDVRSQRPSLVLEAPFFETSSSAELSIETARALLRRGNVDLQLVPTVPFRGDLAAFRRRAPELEPLLVRTPVRPDLWLSTGWPVRADRPDCRVHALRVDYEFGALPFELTPHVTQTADTVVVHSEHVCRAITAAGRPRDRIAVIPHGVDAAMHAAAPPDAELLAWKGDRPAVLFCGGLVWRKGFDVFLRAVLGARAAGADFCVVVKSVGHDQHYAGFHLGELVQRYLATPGTPPLRRIDGDLSRGQLAGVYTACDLLLHPYRGEGFCLPVLEARACGLPVLATMGGATDAMMVGPGATKLPSVARAVDLPAAHLSQPWILEPDAAACTAALLDALGTLPERRRAARVFARSVRTAYTWDSAAQSLEAMVFAATASRAVSARRPEPIVELPAAAPAASAFPVPRLLPTPG
jgi:glycosyltransferase involved in cell wall biosynthesis